MMGSNILTGMRKDRHSQALVKFPFGLTRSITTVEIRPAGRSILKLSIYRIHHNLLLRDSLLTACPHIPATTSQIRMCEMPVRVEPRLTISQLVLLPRRPMTAPSSSVMPQTNYYHASHTGGMFPPSAYSFAGFPHALSGRYILPPAQLAAPPGPLALLGDAIGPTTYLEGGKLISGPRPYSSSNFPERPGAVAQYAQQRPPGSSGGPNDDHYGPAPPGSSGGMFSHHPPPLASNGGHANAVQYPHTMPAPPTSSHGQPNSYEPGLMTSASHPRPTGQAMPDNYLATHAAQEILNAAQMQMHVRQQLGSSHGLRPDTAATARPDTAVSTYSTGGPVYEVRGGGVSEVALLGGAPAPPVGRPTSSHGTIQPTRGKAPVAAEASTSGATQQYDFVPLPSHPKKRPRRRFEEIERIYDCSYPGCPKAYGTLNHLNAHVSMQKHGPKRLPAGELKSRNFYMKLTWV